MKRSCDSNSSSSSTHTHADRFVFQAFIFRYAFSILCVARINYLHTDRFMVKVLKLNVTIESSTILYISRSHSLQHVVFFLSIRSWLCILFILLRFYIYYLVVVFEYVYAANANPYERDREGLKSKRISSTVLELIFFYGYS